MSELAPYDPDTGEILGYEPPIVPVADARPTWHEVGRIRVGVKVPDPKAKLGWRPGKLNRFRLTSPSQGLIEHAADLYGGRPELWKDAPGAERDGGEQWQVTTTRNTLPVRIPPAAAASQAWEAWSGGGCERRCDGRWEVFSDGPCICTAEAEYAIGQGRTYERPCRKTTRVSVMLEELPGAGIWRLETHSTISGDELATWLRIVFPYLPPMAPLVLRVTKTERKRRVPSQKHERGWDWQTFVFPLVSIDTRDQTIGELLAQRSLPAPGPVREVAARVADQTAGPGVVPPVTSGPATTASVTGPGDTGVSTGQEPPNAEASTSRRSPSSPGGRRDRQSRSEVPGGASAGTNSGETTASGEGPPTGPQHTSDEAEQAAFEQALADDADPEEFAR